MDKSPEAFRTISEVGEDMDLPQHVLRFWETRFPQIKPLKRGGGRRYYRPDDVALLRAIKQLLYGQGYTIKGVQKLLKEQGVAAVALRFAESADAQTDHEQGTAIDTAEKGRLSQIGQNQFSLAAGGRWRGLGEGMSRHAHKYKERHQGRQQDGNGMVHHCPARKSLSKKKG